MLSGGQNLAQKQMAQMQFYLVISSLNLISLPTLPSSPSTSLPSQLIDEKSEKKKYLGTLLFFLSSGNFGKAAYAEEGQVGFVSDTHNLQCRFS